MIRRISRLYYFLQTTPINFDFGSNEKRGVLITGKWLTRRIYVGIERVFRVSTSYVQYNAKQKMMRS